MKKRLAGISDISSVVLADGYSNVFEHMLNGLYDGIGLFEIKCEKIRAIYLNDRYFDTVGYTKEQYYPYFDNITVTLFEEDEERVFAQIAEAHGNNTDYYFEVRGRRFDGSVGWFCVRARKADFVKNDVPVFLALLSDISRQKEIERELNINRERNRILQETTSLFLFEYNCMTDTMKFSPGRARKDVYVENYANHLRRSNNVHPDDVSYYYNALNRACRKESRDFIDIRFLNKQGTDYIMCRNYYSSLANEFGEVMCVVGCTEVLSEDPAYLERYRRSGGNEDTIEFITPCNSGIEAISDRISSSDDKGFLAIVDIDDFMGFNREYGYVTADSALRLTAQLLKDIFPDAVIFRYMGDQFVVYIEGISECELYDMTDKLRISGETMSITQADGTQSGVCLTFSIGAAWTVNGIKTNFNDYFVTAAKALFKAKKDGKNKMILEKIIY